MKLAESLQERADLNRNISQLKTRLINNALVQEGEKTPEDPEELKKELDQSISRLEYLISRINITNARTLVGQETLTEVIAKKDALSLKISAYKDITYAASQIPGRARNTEIKIKSSIQVSSWQKTIDKMSKELRQLDNKLQETNWSTELIE